MIECFLQSKTSKKLVLCGKSDRTFDNDRIIHLGFVQDAVLDVLYKNCAAFVFPSKYEGFGLPILEALARGAHVYSSNAGALSEFNNKFINFFNPYEPQSLISLFNNNETKKYSDYELSQYLEQFNWQAITTQMMNTIKNISK